MSAKVGKHSVVLKIHLQSLQSASQPNWEKNFEAIDTPIFGVRVKPQLGAKDSYSYTGILLTV